MPVGPDPWVTLHGWSLCDILTLPRRPSSIDTSSVTVGEASSGWSPAVGPGEDPRHCGEVKVVFGIFMEFLD